MFLDLEAVMLLPMLSKLVQSLSRSVRKLLRYVLFCNPLAFCSSFFSCCRLVFLPLTRDYTHWVKKNGILATVSDCKFLFDHVPGQHFAVH